MIAFHLSDDQSIVNLNGIAGLCIIYKAEKQFAIQLAGPYPEKNVDYYMHSVSAAYTVTLLELPIENFKQEGWGTTISIEEVLANYVSSINFSYEAPAGKQNSIQIYAVGLSGTCKIQ